MSVTLERLIRTPVLRAYGQTLARHVGTYWVVYGVVLAAIAAFNSYFAIGVNATPSLAYTICLIAKGDLEVRRGDLVAFRWRGGGPYPEGVVFTKIVRGLPGDEVTREDRAFYVNGSAVGWAKPFTASRAPLALGPIGVIPEGHYYVSGTHPDSLDSRYALAGWIPRSALIGRAYVVF
jgi:conjugal transfer pilin signal peptidase TrbI